MKISKRTIDDLLTMISHSKTDISFGDGGSFTTGKNFDEYDVKDAKKVERAIDFIRKLILEREL